MKLTIQDVSVWFVFSSIHAHQFFTKEEADWFCDNVEGRWERHPSVNHMHGYPVELISNTAGCFVHSYRRPEETKEVVGH